MRSWSIGAAAMAAAALIWTNGADAVEGAPKDVQSLIDRGDAYNDICRDFPPEDRAAARACERRDQLLSEIEKRGWCLGPKDASDANKTWMPCGAPQSSDRALAPSAEKPLTLGGLGKFIRPAMACPDTIWLDVFEKRVNTADLSHDSAGRLEASVNAQRNGCGPVPVGTTGKLVDIEAGIVGLTYYRIRMQSGAAYWVNSKTVEAAE